VRFAASRPCSLRAGPLSIVATGGSGGKRFRYAETAFTQMLDTASCSPPRGRGAIRCAHAQQVQASATLTLGLEAPLALRPLFTADAIQTTPEMVSCPLWLRRGS
jgi:hypothetical protein